MADKQNEGMDAEVQMKPLVLQPTDVAQWYALVNEAQAACQCNLDEPLESYLVFLLMRFAERPDLAGRVMALEFLQAQRETEQITMQLRDVGDQCLLFSGLFPQLAERRLVKVSYFVGIGQAAYDQLASRVDRHSDRLYGRLAEAFVAIMDVLQAMRGLSGEAVLQPLAAAELWADTGSQSALRSLSETSDSLPVSHHLHRKHRH
ncbi:MAG: hypothetical protein U9P00_11615 [Pseudomonadota bacterium]|nr:hypothetical protein [Pseudomonadota bacterium]